MGCGRSVAVGSFRSPAAWQEAERLGSAELLQRTRKVTPAAQGIMKTAFNPKMHYTFLRKEKEDS